MSDPSIARAHCVARAGGRRAVRLAGAVLFLLAGQAAASAAASVERGRAFAQANCSRCHAIGPTGDSPMAEAPPFRTLHENYPVETLAESLAEGIASGHPAMPEFVLTVPQIDDFIDYLKSLEH